MASMDAPIVGTYRTVRFRAGPVDPIASDVDLLIGGMPVLSATSRIDPGACALDAALSGTLSQLRAGGLFDGRFGETMILSSPPPPVRCRSLMIVGMGEIDDLDAERLGRLAAVAMRAALRLDSCSIACLLRLLDPAATKVAQRAAARAMMAGVLTALDAYLSPGPTPGRFAGLNWTFDQPDSAADVLGTIIAQWPAAPR